MEATMVNVVQCISIVALFGAYVISIVKKIRDQKNQTVLDFASALIDEGIAFSEDANRVLKREAASEAGKALRKESVELTKDPVKVEKYLQAALAPAREIAHSSARSYIESAINKVKDKTLQAGVKNILGNKTMLDSAIKMRISGPKCGIGDPLKALLYREI